jgi:hypothetical protein
VKYMLLCYDDEQAWAKLGPEALRAAMAEAVQTTHELDAKGQYILASPLHPAASAKSIKVRDGRRIVTDGPYAETREVLGGFYIIDVGTLEEALEVAARHPGARFGGVEVRPILEIPGLPAHS